MPEEEEEKRAAYAQHQNYAQRRTVYEDNADHLIRCGITPTSASSPQDIRRCLGLGRLDKLMGALHSEVKEDYRGYPEVKVRENGSRCIQKKQHVHDLLRTEEGFSKLVVGTLMNIICQRMQESQSDRTGKESGPGVGDLICADATSSNSAQEFCPIPFQIVGVNPVKVRPVRYEVLHYPSVVSSSHYAFRVLKSGDLFDPKGRKVRKRDPPFAHYTVRHGGWVNGYFVGVSGGYIDVDIGQE